jgi:hypothetical protein
MPPPQPQARQPGAPAAIVGHQSGDHPQGPPPGTAPRPWWKKKRVIALAVVLFLLIVAVASGPDSDQKKPPGQGRTESTATESTQPEKTAPAKTRADAVQAVDDDNYVEALAIATALGVDDEHYIAQRISRRLARRVIRAVSSGDRRQAHLLLREAKKYPTTSLTRTAKRRYEVAQAQADARRQARADARAQRRQARAAAREQARAQARARRDAAAAAPDAPASGGAPDTSGPSTTNWCGKRDGDGDGIYCEGE